MASAPRNLSLKQGKHKTFSVRALTNGDIIFDMFAFHSIIRTMTYAHHNNFAKTANEESILLPSQHQILPPNIARLFREATKTKTTEEAVRRMMQLQSFVTGTMLKAKSVSTLYANLHFDVYNGEFIEHFRYSYEPVKGGENIVRASSPLRCGRDLVGLYTAQSVCDTAIPTLACSAIENLAEYLTHNAQRKARAHLLSRAA